MKKISFKQNNGKISKNSQLSSNLKLFEFLNDCDKSEKRQSTKMATNSSSASASAKRDFSKYLVSSAAAIQHRLPYHYPPDRENIGQLNYGTFENSAEISSTFTTFSNRYRRTQSLNQNQHEFLPESDQHLAEEASRYSRYRYYNRLFNTSVTSNSNNLNHVLENSQYEIQNSINIPVPAAILDDEPEIRMKSPMNRSSSNRKILSIPDHVLPWYFLLSPEEVEDSEEELIDGDGESSSHGGGGHRDRRQSSIVTIFAIWNMMMGTSLLCLPWAMHRAGLIGGLVSMVVMIGLCFYTASLVIHVPQIVSVQVVEFTDLCAILLGSFAHKVAQISSLSIITGGCIVYWILMNNFLRHVITFVYQVQFLNTTVGLNLSSVICTAPVVPSPEPNPDNNHDYDQLLAYSVPFILTLILGPIMCLRSVAIFLRFNIVGTLSVFYLMAFCLIKAYSWGTINFSLQPSSPHYTPLFSWNFPIYTGVLSLALFIHNCLTTLLRTQRNPEHNYRDLAIAYILVGFTYLLIGTSIYVGFPLDKNCIKDNFLDNLESNDLFAFITRIFLLLQVIALFPLLVYMLRIQALSLFQDNDSHSGHSGRRQNHQRNPHRFAPIFLLNLSLLTVCILFAIYYPQIGAIIRYCGSFSGFLLIFTLPPLTFIRARQIQDRPIGNCGLLILGFIILLGFANFVLQFFVYD